MCIGSSRSGDAGLIGAAGIARVQHFASLRHSGDDSRHAVQETSATRRV
jgi:hypothetical protein